MNQLKQQWLRYWLAMNATAFDSAVHAVVLLYSVAGAHEVTGNVPTLNAQQMGWVFLIAFTRSLLAYLDAHPISVLLPETRGGDEPVAGSFRGQVVPAPIQRSSRAPAWQQLCNSNPRSQ